MSTTRKLTKAEELLLTSILTESEKSRQDITDSLTKMADDAFFIAALCARAFNDPHEDHHKNILCKIFSILKPDQFSELYEELIKLLTKVQVNTLFLTYLDANIDVKSWIRNQCQKDMDYSLLHMFASKFALGDKSNGNSSLLLAAIYEIPLTDKSRIETIKKLVKENVRFGGFYILNPALKTFDYAVDNKDYEVIEYMSEVASNLENKENLQHIANGIVRAITDDKISGYCNEVIKAVNKKLNPQHRNDHIEIFRKSLTQDQANKAYLAHMNDAFPSEALNLLIHYGIDAETYLQAIETCKDINTAVVYLNQLLEKKPSQDMLDKVIYKVTDRSVDSKNWCLADALASKIIPGNEKKYGDILVTAAKNGQKEIFKKLIKANAKLTWYIPNTKKYALHFMLEHQWNDIIAEMLTNAEGIKLLAEGIACVIRQPDCTDVIKNVNDLLKDNPANTPFYEALRVSLTQKEANDAFIMHVNDKDWIVLNMLMNYGVSTDVLIKNLETTTYDEHHPIYINKISEKKLDTPQLAKMMDFALARSRKIGDWSLVDMIASKKIQISGSEKIYAKALLEVVKKNKSENVELINKLIQANAFLNEQTEDTQNTALHLAAEQGDCQLAYILANAGANIDIKNKEMKTPEDLAMSNGRYYLAAILKSKNKEKIKAQQDKYNIQKLNIFYHFFENDDDSLQHILDEDLLCKAQDEKNQSHQVRTELTKFVFNTVNECKTQDGSKNNLSMLILLLGHNLLGIPALELKALLAYRDDDGNTALHKAVMNGHFDLVKTLLNAGANPNKSNNLGQTPLNLAEKNSNLSIVKLLRTDFSRRDNVCQDIKHEGGNNEFKQYLQKKESEIKIITYKALAGDHNALQKAIKHCHKKNNFDRLLVLSAIGAMYSQLDSQLTCYRSEITNLKIDNLSRLLNRMSKTDKIKLKYLQDFFSNNLNALCEAKKQYKDLDSLILILVVMKQKLINPTYEQTIIKHKIQSSIRFIMRDELGMSPEEIDQQMDRSQYIVDQILGLHQPELEQKAGEKESDLLRAALQQGEVRGFRRMIDAYYKDTRIAELPKFRLTKNVFPRHGRHMLFCAAIAPFVGESDYATYLFYLKNLNPKTMFRSYNKIQVLTLMKKFYLYSFDISKYLIEYYKIKDPFIYIFLVLEYVSKFNVFTDAEIRTINYRLKESLSSAIRYEGAYTKTYSNNFITDKENQVAAIIQSNPLVKKEPLQTSAEVSMQHTKLPSAPLMPDLLPAATEVTTYTGPSIPPLAQVVQPEVIVNVSGNPSTLFSQSNPTKLPTTVTKDLECLQVKEQLLDTPIPPNSRDDEPGELPIIHKKVALC